MNIKLCTYLSLSRYRYKQKSLFSFQARSVDFLGVKHGSTFAVKVSVPTGKRRDIGHG